MKREKNQSKPNGHDGPRHRTNGSLGQHGSGANCHSPASPKRGGTSRQRGRAASDDANGAASAKAADSATAAGTDRDACAEAAPPRSGRNRRNPKPKSQKKESEKLFHLTGSTNFAALQDGAAYVNAVASRVDLVGASVLLVGSEDEKIAKSELDRLREMKFGKGPVTVIEEYGQVEPGNIPRPAQ